MRIIFTVPQSHCVILERFGKYSRTCNEGLHVRIPVVEQIRTVRQWGSQANKDGHLIELTEQQSDSAPRQCHTKDNVTISANVSVYWRIIDPVSAAYEVDVLPQSVADLALNALRSNVGTMDLDQVLAERQTLNERIREQLSQVASKWGVQFSRTEIQELTTSDATATAMRQQMEAERARRATVAKAEGKAEAELKVAEAERHAMILRAQGQAEALEVIAGAERNYLRALSETIDAAQATQVLIAQKMLSGFDRISRNPAHKVFLPNTFQGLHTLETETPPK